MRSPGSGEWTLRRADRILGRVKFQTIKITGGQADTTDPRAAPGSVPPELLVDVPVSLTGSDLPPSKMVLALEGTTAQTVSVQQYILDETAQAKVADLDDPKVNDAARRFYPFGAAQVVTCPTAVAIATVPGRLYLRLTTAPAANATLKIGFAP